MEETSKVSRWDKPVGELTTKDQLVITGVVAGGIIALSAAYGVTMATVAELRQRRAAKRDMQAKNAKNN